MNLIHTHEQLSGPDGPAPIAAEVNRPALVESSPNQGEEAELVAQAIIHLRAARALLRTAGAPRAVERVQAAIKSAEGARRHAELKPVREARQAQSQA